MRWTSLDLAADSRIGAVEPALDRVGRGAGRCGRGGGARVIGRDRAPQPAGEGAGRHRHFRFEIVERVRPGRVHLRRGLGRAQESRADLHRGGAEDQCRGHAAAVGDAASGDDRHAELVGEPRHEREEADRLPLGLGRIEGAAMAARLETLRDDGIRPCRFGGAGLGQRRGAGEPGDAARLQLGDKRVREEAHDRRDDTRGGREQRIALLIEIERLRVACLGRHRRPPLPEKVANTGLVLAIARRFRIGDPQIDLEGAIALAAKLLRPGGHTVRRGCQRAQSAHAASIGDRRRQPDRAGARHRRLQNRDAQPEPPAKGFGALPRVLLLRHRSPPADLTICRCEPIGYTNRGRRLMLRLPL